jgi:hypothetical protein
MKTVLYLFVFITLLSNLLIANPDLTNEDLQYVRTTYYSAVENEDEIVTLNNYITKRFGNNKNNYPPIILAYVAGIEALKSKHAFWITTKYNYLVKSMEIFEKAVEKDPNNLEIRFMRFSILHYVPSIVGYGNEKNADLNTVYSLLVKKRSQNLPNDIIAGMIQFLIDSDRLEPNRVEELIKLKNDLLAKL